MSLSAKLEGDNLTTLCVKEVEDLHRLFVAWFQGESTAEALTRDLQERLDPQFSHVAPNGQFLQGRDVLIGHLQDKFGCYKDRLFQIDIYAVQLLWHANGQALCTYEEWQSWQPDDDTEEIHQFGRLSTCLLHRKTTPSGERRYQWIHVHETWLEAEEPEHPKEMRISTATKPPLGKTDDNETVMTGPVEYKAGTAPPSVPGVAAATAPPQAAAKSMLYGGGNDDDDDDDDDEEDDNDSEDEDSEDESGDNTNDSDEENEEGEGEDSADHHEKGSLPLPPETEKHVLMLASHTSLSQDQMDRQDKARKIFASSKIEFYELNGADQKQRDKRNELFKLSGKWGRYPQFFLFDTDGNTIFWGDWENLEASHQKGTLMEDLQQTPSEDPVVGKTLPEDGDESTGEEPTSSPATPIAANGHDEKANGKLTTTPPGLLLLISSQVLSADHKERQQEVVTTLKQRKIPYMEVDGSIPGKRDQRNELFKLSKVWGLYPQIFKIDKETRDITYWGGWEDFEDAKEEGNLESQLGIDAPEAKPEQAPVSRGLPLNGDVAEVSNEEAAALSTLASSESKIILLISNHSLSNEQMARQDNCRRILDSKKIQYQEIDGSARDRRDKRNELFKVSKLWGRYPQLFVTKSSGETVFWGEWEAMNERNKEGNFVQALAKTAADGVAVSAGGAVAATDGNDNVLETAEEAPPEQRPTDVPIQIGAVSETGTAEADDQKESKIEEKTAIATEDDEQESDGESESESESDGDAESEEEEEDEEELPPGMTRNEKKFLEASDGILTFEEDEEEEEEEENKININAEDAENTNEIDAEAEEEKLKKVQTTPSPIPQDASSKRHVNPKILKYAKPLTWENTLVGISIAGFDIGTSQGPIADESWYKEVGDGLESIAQCRSVPRPRRQISLPEMVFPTAHVALEGHGVWMSWDALDAMEEWARAHQDISVHSSATSRGVSVLKAKDAKLWESKRQHLTSVNSSVPSVFHYDWTFSSPFAGKIEGGSWVELDESGMRTELLTDKTSPILFFDEIILYEDDLHDNGQVEFSVKLRVMPSCAYVLSRLFVRVDNVVVRVRETRLLIDFFGIKPKIFRDVKWRECYWDDLAPNGLPSDVRSWTFEAADVATFQSLIQQLPEVDLPEGIYKFATLEPDTPLGASASNLQNKSRISNDSLYEM